MKQNVAERVEFSDSLALRIAILSERNSFAENTLRRNYQPHAASHAEGTTSAMLSWFPQPGAQQSRNGRILPPVLWISIRWQGGVAMASPDLTGRISLPTCIRPWPSKM
jgi:hypothetical protein